MLSPQVRIDQLQILHPQKLRKKTKNKQTKMTLISVLSHYLALFLFPIKTWTEITHCFPCITWNLFINSVSQMAAFSIDFILFFFFLRLNMFFTHFITPFAPAHLAWVEWPIKKSNVTFYTYLSNSCHIGWHDVFQMTYTLILLSGWYCKPFKTRHITHDNMSLIKSKAWEHFFIR